MGVNCDSEKFSRLLTDINFQAIEQASSYTCGPVVSTFSAKPIKVVESLLLVLINQLLFITLPVSEPENKRQ